MRLVKASAWILGGAVTATAGLLLGAWVGPAAAGPGIALASIAGGLVMIDHGMGVW